MQRAEESTGNNEFIGPMWLILPNGEKIQLLGEGERVETGPINGGGTELIATLAEIHAKSAAANHLSSSEQ
jgi:hypothetical protein